MTTEARCLNCSNLEQAPWTFKGQAGYKCKLGRFGGMEQWYTLSGIKRAKARMIAHAQRDCPFFQEDKAGRG